VERSKLVATVTNERLAHVLDVVRAWQPMDEHGVDSKRRVEDMLATNPLPFSREASKHHITASAVVLSDAGVLMHLHKIANIWTGPGGHVDGDEYPHDAVRREVLEETGLQARHPSGGPLVVHIDVHQTTAGHDHVHYDLCHVLLAPPDPPNPPEGESQQVGWYSFEDVDRMTDASWSSAFRQVRSLSPDRLR
jgi:8-oxo-dGTP pyrophosphatase MutT (NUDIX family)